VLQAWAAWVRLRITYEAIRVPSDQGEKMTVRQSPCSNSSAGAHARQVSTDGEVQRARSHHSTTSASQRSVANKRGGGITLAEHVLLSPGHKCVKVNTMVIVSSPPLPDPAKAPQRTYVTLSPDKLEHQHKKQGGHQLRTNSTQRTTHTTVEAGSPRTRMHQAWP
jgi:hypothetical protein